ncbi:hypothetical protein TIFTF001_035008 [Ficus carica]|uniref:Uncharacterized protein n=1 Tax=Ficus carica TaxID=3494 RepID=A0AA88J9Q1_FICCA|nr:hypothetical protein TIFTF001_035008 [Ficus carica]
MTLDLKKNNLEGSIPPHLGNLSSLQALYLSTNRFKGDVPASLGQLKRTLYLSSNQFQGSLPRNLGLALPNIETFSVWGNQFGGRIPLSISNASKLSAFVISINNFFGGVSVTIFGNLEKLTWLDLGDTYLGSAKADDLKFITSLTNCSSLRHLYLDNSNFGGELPDSVGNLSTQIESLSLAFNPISGNIPPEYGMGSKVSTEGDVYSFGILLLEMFTRKRPTDGDLYDAMNLNQFAKKILAEVVPLEEIVHGFIKREESEVASTSNNNCAQTKGGNTHECLFSIISIGIKCSEESPKYRMNINDALRELLAVKNVQLQD